LKTFIVNSTNKKFEEYAQILSGECTPEEKQILRERLVANAGEKAEFEKIQNIWDNYSPETKSSAGRIWELTSSKLEFESQTKKVKLNSWMKYAAAALVVLSLGLNLYWFIGHRNTSTSWVEYSTKNGEIRKITLPDGSTVTLNSESILLCQNKFEKNARNVFLMGEAFFHVTKNPEAPFSVNTSEMTVRVLGTSFNVSSYANDPVISTSLEEGKVQIFTKEKPSEPVVLKPQDEALLERASGEITVNNQQKLIAPWREGRLRFHDNELLAITHQLERKFDCTFIFVDQDAETLRFTGDFENESLDEILELLNKAHSFKLKKSGKRYVISL
jgi:ferric-dicitrate binding protein FerR (iron transport regulator)